MKPRGKSGVDHELSGEVSVLTVSGVVDDGFDGFGTIDPSAKALVIDVSGMTRMTSFGVRQWMKAAEAIPKTITDQYLLGCPTFFVDQLNMVLNFAGSSSVLSVLAPYMCIQCGGESAEVLDVLGDRTQLLRGAAPDRQCSVCSSKLELDESADSYFGFVKKHGATAIRPDVAQYLATLGRYYAPEAPADGEKPPRTIKLVHGSVTYFRIIGTIGTM